MSCDFVSAHSQGQRGGRAEDEEADRGGHGRLPEDEMY
jgi:hypothetical protein